MPRATKKDRFFVLAAKSSGYWKGKQLIGINHKYEGNPEELTLQDLLLFLEEHNIDPAEVLIGKSFITCTKVK